MVDLVVRGTDPRDRVRDEDDGDGAERSGAETRSPAQQEDQGEHEVDLPLDRDRPERAVGSKTPDDVLEQETVDHEPLRHRSACEIRLQNERSDGRDHQRCPVWRDDSPRPPAQKAAGASAQAPAPLHRRKREGEARHDDEHRHCEVAVKQPPQPPWANVAGEAIPHAQENVVEHDEHRRRSTDSVHPVDATTRPRWVKRRRLPDCSAHY